MELDWTTRRASGVTLVAIRLQNERAADRTVRLENQLDGPVLPPRRQGEPEQGWDREGVTKRIPAGDEAALGYACPADATDPPVVVESVEAAGEPANDELVAQAIRQLGDARPPRSVLGETPESEQEPAKGPTGSPNEGQGGAESHPTEAPPNALPAGAGALLQPYRERLETVEALGVASVPEATGLLETNGGLAGIEQMGSGLTADAAALRALASEATALAARAETASLPTASLRKLS
ncbi:hypothetical protein [Halolamina sp.]|jgi:hypothetical protein|uniref:DUF7857 domain-containing protein n=1 Tax=Halolamina sp. TaxID=1940283 RepID=UPI000223C027|nr:hypothetical protein Halar_3448 [halophilic archaeon DL31]